MLQSNPRLKLKPWRIEPSLIQIPAGWFLMGSTAGQDCERPVHRVWVDAFCWPPRKSPMPNTLDFFAHPALRSLRSGKIQTSTIRNNPSRQFPGSRPCTTANGSARKPAAPTACPPKPNGNMPPAAAWNRKISPGATTPPQSLPDYATRWQTGPEPVARYAPNAFGLYDICDNVHEWCSDWYDPNYYAISPDRNPRGPEQSQAQILPRWILAPPHQSRPLLRPFQHPPRIPIRRLRLPHSV